ncbi:MAG: hypothetical protein VXX20_09805 [Verrucomicrobiota bacterium]|nr:hypothetical protein [Verrucomicrobiota bacterium]
MILFLGNLKILIVNPADINVIEGLPPGMLSHQDIRRMQFIVNLTKVCIEMEIARGTSTRRGETGGDELTVGGFLFLENFHFVALWTTTPPTAKMK